ncbi:unnamed protein product [Paramecium octaurelia]|uniref:Transmembrane protein n=1 Tax=Paramecium octaurelia TaxID=43137 RepID=A0A8S1YH48_PAROT|nr:unnamed protein product [Paramecium octaurelia]
MRFRKIDIQVRLVIVMNPIMLLYFLQTNYQFLSIYLDNKIEIFIWWSFLYCLNFQFKNEVIFSFYTSSNNSNIADVRALINLIKWYQEECWDPIKSKKNIKITKKKYFKQNTFYCDLKLNQFVYQEYKSKFQSEMTNSILQKQFFSIQKKVISIRQS